MTPNEKQYKSMINRIAISLLFFQVLFLFYGVVLGLLPSLTAGLTARAQTVVYELASGLMYAASFSFPVLLFCKLPLGGHSEPMRMRLRAPRGTLVYLLFGLGIINAAAYVNAYMVDVFHYSEASEEVLWNFSVTSNEEMILLFFTLAVVPAFVEELLFRGVVLSNLLPYGRTTAIIASGMLFGLMHQNVGQIFYATAAGIVLGWIYVKTQSIWPGVLLHFVNNFLSVLRTGISERLPQATAAAILYALEGGILLLGLAAGVFLLLLQRDIRAGVRRTGVYERQAPVFEEYAERAIPVRRAARVFFTIPMICFVAWCVVQMGLVMVLLLLV